MHHTICKSVLAICAALATLSGHAQNDDIILRALKDELRRSMELRETGYDNPFFISYGLTDAKVHYVYASHGAIVQSSGIPNRAKSMRILVGSYAFNDESLDNDSFTAPAASEIQVPIDDDYDGIRRAFWATTDAVYRGAAQKFRKHQQTLKDQNRKLDDIPHRTFGRVPQLNHIAPSPTYVDDRKQMEDICRRMSLVFKTHPGMESSDVMMNFTAGKDYFINSEGTVVVKPFSLAVLQCRVELKTPRGESLTESLEYYASTPEEFPAIQKLLADANTMATKLEAQVKSPALEDEYSGPVLFLGSAVANVFTSALFSYSESLVASDDIPVAGEYRTDNASLLDTRIGKPIIDNILTIKATPKRKKFDGQSLLAAYDVDDEGVMPPDELILVDKGTLLNQLNDRSLTRKEQKPNGHAAGPAVIDVSASHGSSEEVLKKKLIELAITEDMPFALIVRRSGDVRGNMAEVWKVDLATGHETLMRPSQVRYLSLRELRRVAGCSNTQMAHNTSVGEGALMSLICPSALLLERVDVIPLQTPYQEEQSVFVPSPLGK